jgi:hypothetical protein
MTRWDGWKPRPERVAWGRLPPTWPAFQHLKKSGQAHDYGLTHSHVSWFDTKWYHFETCWELLIYIYIYVCVSIPWNGWTLEKGIWSPWNGHIAWYRGLSRTGEGHIDGFRFGHERKVLGSSQAGPWGYPKTRIQVWGCADTAMEAINEKRFHQISGSLGEPFCNDLTIVAKCPKCLSVNIFLKMLQWNWDSPLLFGNETLVFCRCKTATRNSNPHVLTLKSPFLLVKSHILQVESALSWWFFTFLTRYLHLEAAHWRPS